MNHDPFVMDRLRVVERMRHHFYRNYHDHDYAKFFDDIDGHIRDPDAPYDGAINIEEMFMYVVNVMKLNVRRQQISALVETYDTDNSGQIEVAEFKELLSPVLSPARKAMIFRTYKLLNTGHPKGRIPLDYLMSIFEPHFHVNVKEGYMAADTFRKKCQQALTTTAKVVSCKNFIDFWVTQSYYYEKDDAFCSALSLTWGIPYIPGYALQSLFHLLHTAVQKECDAKLCSPAIYLEGAYKDLQRKHPSWNSKKRLARLLHDHGISLTDRELDAVFNIFDVNGDGEVDEIEFRSHVMYEFEHRDFRVSKAGKEGNEKLDGNELVAQRLEHRMKAVANAVGHEKGAEQTVMQNLFGMGTVEEMGEAEEAGRRRTRTMSQSSKLGELLDDEGEPVAVGPGAIREGGEYQWEPPPPTFSELSDREARRRHRRVQRKNSRDSRIAAAK